MPEKKPILEGDLVTIDTDEHYVGSNTYQVLKKLPSECVLSHPLAPECLIIKADLELNNTFPSMQSSIERCLKFAKANRSDLGFSTSAELDSLTYYFIIKKQLSSKQRNDLANICGKIAAIILGNNVAAAVSEIKHNKALLDEYNHSLCNSVKGVLQDPLSLEGKGQRFTIFNIAGFILAQLSN